VRSEGQFRRLADLIKAAGPQAVVRRIVVRDAKGRKRYRYVEVMGDKQGPKGRE
jgi:hypothetical protein